jgi:pimeloyl-ACP methyl ester carboxylesterase
VPAEITGGRRVVRLDLRGHGASAHAPGTYLIDRYGADVAAVLERVAARPAVVVGHSLGGVAAWWFAQRRTGRSACATVAEDALRSRAHAQLAVDPEVLTAAADRSTLAATDTTSPVTVPMLILAADDAMNAAFPTRHERRLAATHPDVEVVRVEGASHGIHDEIRFRAAYVEHLAAFLRRHARAPA